jgi:hypothetical protein
MPWKKPKETQLVLQLLSVVCFLVTGAIWAKGESALAGLIAGVLFIVGLVALVRASSN